MFRLDRGQLGEVMELTLPQLLPSGIAKPSAVAAALQAAMPTASAGVHTFGGGDGTGDGGGGVGGGDGEWCHTQLG